MIKSIVFDWGGVLIDRPTPGLLHYFAEYFKVSEERFNNAHKKYRDSLQKGILTEKIYWNKMFANQTVIMLSSFVLLKIMIQKTYLRSRTTDFFHF